MLWQVEKLGLSAPELTQGRAIQDRWKLADGEKLEKLTAAITVCDVLPHHYQYYPMRTTQSLVLLHHRYEYHLSPLSPLHICTCNFAHPLHWLNALQVCCVWLCVFICVRVCMYAY